MPADPPPALSAQAPGQHFTEKTAADIMRQLMHALKYLHGKKIVHRDLKPENFLLADKSEHAKIKIADFGAVCVISLAAVCVISLARSIARARSLALSSFSFSLSRSLSLFPHSPSPSPAPLPLSLPPSASNVVNQPYCTYTPWHAHTWRTSGIT